MKSPRSLLPAISATLLLGASGLVSACDDAVDSEENDVSSKTSYVDLRDFLTKDPDIEKWIDIRIELGREFDRICGDTFCGGDFSNIYSLGFTCSVSSIQGRIRECVWTFAAGQEEVNGATGTIASTIPFYECRMRPTGTVRNFLPAFFNTDQRIDSELPGIDGSIYDQLGDCFDQPLGADPLPEPTDGPFANATDNLDENEINAWYPMVAAFNSTFDEVCGDTFCEGEYSNLQPLRFSCSMNTETHRLQSCAWVFAGSNVERNAKGFNVIDQARFVCSFPVDATPEELTSALDPNGNGEDVLHRPLPNSDSSIFDALADCL